jgi:glycosyltransferase involved in cell wall biosynthesis
LKILLAGQTFGPRNGPGVFTRNLARGLAAAGHEVAVAVPAQPLPFTEGVRVVQVRSFSLAPIYRDVHVSFRSRSAAKRLLRDFKPDIVHVQDHYPLSRAIVRAAPVPIVVTNHFLTENISEQTWLGRVGAFNRFSWRLALDVLNAATIVTAPTKTAADILVRDGVTRPVRAISCGVDTRRFSPGSGARKWGSGVYVGRLDRDKDVVTLVEAVSMLDNVQLIVVGRGREERRLHALATAAVTFAGFVDDEKLIDELRSAEFFAIAGRAELQSIATLEAMACGLPVVAANALALPELVTSGINGELFRPGDAADCARAMEAVIARRASWDAMSRASRERAEQHDISRTVAAYEKLYAELL